MLTVQPTGASAYTRPVYILTSNVTVSGGENLTLAMMGRQGVRRIGETTAGAYADQLTKPMPNGWSYSISNEVFEGIDGRVYEAKGIPPDVVVNNSVLLAQPTRDPVIEHVLRLTSQTGHRATR